jgi:hypothetical protein
MFVHAQNLRSAASDYIVGLMIPNSAPCGSDRTAMRPTVGTSTGGMQTLPRSLAAFFTVASTLSTSM